MAIGPGGADPLMARWYDHHLQRPDTRMQPIPSDRINHVTARRKEDELTQLTEESIHEFVFL